jgi:hypothetical protein
MVGLLPLDRLFAAVAFLVRTGFLVTVLDSSSRDFTAGFFTARFFRIGCFFADFFFFALRVDFFATVVFLGVGFDFGCFFLVFFLATIGAVYHRGIFAVPVPYGF